MSNIKIDISNSGYNMEQVKTMTHELLEAHKSLHEGTGQGNDFIGWLDLPVNYDKAEFDRMKAAAARIREKAEVFIVVGIGGSYLGAKAALEALGHSFYNQLPADQRKGPEIYFIGQNISGTYMSHLMEIIRNKEVYVNVISKSGTTTEPAIGFRIIRNYLETKYGKEEARKRIIATTDKSEGALRELSGINNYETFIIPADVGGRYSIFTPVGMLPMAVAGIDVDAVAKGALEAYEEYKNTDVTENPAYTYAITRNLMYRDDKFIEIMVSYEPSLTFIAEWWKQLYGESEGKDGKGIFPASVNFSTDLHSMGQYIQDGSRVLFETVLNIEKTKLDMDVPFDAEDLDKLNFISGSPMSDVNQKAFQGTVLAHVDGGTPNIIINVPEMSDYYFGKLLYFFMKACAISGYILDVNPFNQPGVEAYKKNMFALLGKPGYEDLKAQLLKRL